MLALLAVGRTSGLVVDCGHMETTALPVSPESFENLDLKSF
jgi:actin-related protein